MPGSFRSGMRRSSVWRVRVGAPVHRSGLPYWVSAPIATVIAALLGACLAPLTRLRGHYLAVATLGFGEIVYLVLVNWADVTRGPFGLLNIPPPAIGGLVLATPDRYFYLALAVTCARTRWWPAL